MAKPFLWIIDDEWADYEREKAVFDRAFGADGYELAFSGPKTYREDLPEYGPRADAVLSQIDIEIGPQEMEQLTRCKILSNYGTGYNNIDVREAAARGIAVGYIPGYCAEDIADYVLSAIYRRFKPTAGFEEEIRAGRWGAAVMKEPLHRLSSKKLFLVGFGSIARAVAGKARGAGLLVSAWSPHLTAEKAAAAGVSYQELDAGLAGADVVSLHLRYDKETHHFIGAAEIAKMKKDAILINTARGGVLDTDALVAAVKNGKLGGAVLDVLEQEPPAADAPVLHCQGIDVTPHISYYSEEALGDLQRRAAENAVHILKGEPGADLVKI